MTAQSQSAAVGTAAINFVWTQYYPTLVITNPSTSVAGGGTGGTIAAGTPGVWLYVRTDGTQAVANAANNQAIPPDSVVALGNQLPLPQAEGTNVLGLLNDPLHATQVSVIGSAAGPTEVTVTPQ